MTSRVNWVSDGRGFSLRSAPLRDSTTRQTPRAARAARAGHASAGLCRFVRLGVCLVFASFVRLHSLSVRLVAAAQLKALAADCQRHRLTLARGRQPVCTWSSRFRPAGVHVIAILSCLLLLLHPSNQLRSRLLPETSGTAAPDEPAGLPGRSIRQSGHVWSSPQPEARQPTLQPATGPADRVALVEFDSPSGQSWPRLGASQNSQSAAWTAGTTHWQPTPRGNDAQHRLPGPAVGHASTAASVPASAAPHRLDASLVSRLQTRQSSVPPARLAAGPSQHQQRAANQTGHFAIRSRPGVGMPTTNRQVDTSESDSGYGSGAESSTSGQMVSSGICDQPNSFLWRQRKVCLLYPHLMESVVRGYFMGLKECEHQFSRSRWNCQGYNMTIHSPAPRRRRSRQQRVGLDEARTAEGTSLQPMRIKTYLDKLLNRDHFVPECLFILNRLASIGPQSHPALPPTAPPPRPPYPPSLTPTQGTKNVNSFATPTTITITNSTAITVISTNITIT
ncbi:unnamed protein product, partial [Protopolystoma xenopodis]